MAITANAKKAHKSSLKKRVFNMRRTRTMRETVKEVRDLVQQGKKDEARTKLSAAYKAIDKATKRGIIKENTAARKKSRLNAFIKNHA